MTTGEAKKIVRDALADLGLSNKVSARTIGFEGRDSLIFVKIHDWKPDEKARILQDECRALGFRIEFQGSFINGVS